MCHPVSYLVEDHHLLLATWLPVKYTLTAVPILDSVPDAAVLSLVASAMQIGFTLVCG